MQYNDSQLRLCVSSEQNAVLYISLYTIIAGEFPNNCVLRISHIILSNELPYGKNIPTLKSLKRIKPIKTMFQNFRIRSMGKRYQTVIVIRQYQLS